MKQAVNKPTQPTVFACVGLDTVYTSSTAYSVGLCRLVYSVYKQYSLQCWLVYSVYKQYSLQCWLVYKQYSLQCSLVYSVHKQCALQCWLVLASIQCLQAVQPTVLACVGLYTVYTSRTAYSVLQYTVYTKMYRLGGELNSVVCQRVTSTRGIQY